MTARSLLQEVLSDEYRTRSYSGRAMYGSTCLGVEIESGELGNMVATLIRAAFTDHGDRQELERAVRDLRTDSMGLGMIVYFPGTPFVDNEPLGCAHCDRIVSEEEGPRYFPMDGKTACLCRSCAEEFI